MAVERGDLVRSRSGGPVMTVDRIIGDIAQVSWHTRTGRVGCATNFIASLKKVVMLRDARQVWVEARLGFVDAGTGI